MLWTSKFVLDIWDKFQTSNSKHWNKACSCKLCIFFFEIPSFVQGYIPTCETRASPNAKWFKNKAAQHTLSTEVDPYNYDFTLSLLNRKHQYNTIPTWRRWTVVTDNLWPMHWHSPIYAKVPIFWFQTICMQPQKWPIITVLKMMESICIPYYHCSLNYHWNNLGECGSPHIPADFWRHG
jgi:hypothetical protein